MRKKIDQGFQFLESYVTLLPEGRDKISPIFWENFGINFPNQKTA